MTLLVGPLDAVHAMATREPPARVVSLLSPELEPPRLGRDLPHLVLRFHDIDGPREGLTPPDAAAIDALVAFADAWREPGPMIVHCWMGISRSTAAALILAAAADPDRSEDDAARALRATAAFATPNPLMIALADARLERGGRLIAAVEAIGRGTSAAKGWPFRLPVRTQRNP